MQSFNYRGNAYAVDSSGFLLDFNQWDKEFAEGLAEKLSIPGGLSARHWDVINFIRNSFAENGICPLLYQTCRENNLRLMDLRELFPTGYQRGACRLAGISYRDTNLSLTYFQKIEKSELEEKAEKTYLVDVRGYLVNPDDWDDSFAMFRALETKIPRGELTEKHWEVIRFLRRYHREHGTIPTVYEACEEFHIELDQLARLFPDGYHRGAVKIAGLRL